MSSSESPLPSSSSAYSSSSSPSIADCQLAFAVITHGYGQFTRILLIFLLFLQFALFLPLIREYGRAKTKTALHGNLKFLYVHLAIIYQLGPLGYSLIEVRHMILAFFYAHSPCSMPTPFWYLLLSKAPTMFYIFAIPLLHFSIMLERLRATKFASRYENEGTKFGILMVATIYSLVLAMVGLICLLVLRDMDFDFSKVLAVNTITSKSSNIPYQAITILLMVLVIFTALGDFLVYRKNKELRGQKSLPDSAAPPVYNLSEKYQVRENYTAMRFILPLDITYMLFMVFAYIAVLVLRNLNLDPALYLANYNLINSLMAVYAIISLILYRRFLHGSESKRNGTRTRVLPMEKIGQVYFEQLENQWN